MSDRKNTADRGLVAVARVREFRERDSRLGLQHAQNLARQREREAAQLQFALDQAPAFTEGSTGQFVVARQFLTSMAARAQLAAADARSCRMVADEARVRWQADKTRLRAVEYLLNKRSEARRYEAARKEARELDDVAGRLWIRRHGENGSAA